jgi:hypothetical protein
MTRDEAKQKLEAHTRVHRVDIDGPCRVQIAGSTGTVLYRGNEACANAHRENTITAILDALFGEQA